MKRLLACLLAAALLLCLSACGGGQSSSSAAPPEDSSRQPQSPAPHPITRPVFPGFSLHPVLGANRANLTLSSLLYEGLFQVDEQFQAQPVLCQSYTVSQDKLTWSFTVRPGVTFSTGEPLTGQAVADALELARGPDSRFAQRLADVSSISAQEQTVVITLSHPNGDLPALLDIPIALGGGDRPAGTGPYVLSSSGQALTLLARSGWWQGRALPFSSIPLYPVEKSDELIYAFDTGSVSLLDVDLMATNALGYAGNYQAWDYASTDLIYIGFNTASGLCRDAQVRRALCLALDRQGIAQTAYASHAVPSSLPVHPSSSLWAPEAAQQLDYDPQRLREELEGLDLAGQELRLLVNSENAAKADAARRVAKQLQAAGVTVTLQTLPFEEYTAALARGEFDLYLGETVLTANFDLTALLSSQGSLNYGRWRDGGTDALIAALNAASGQERPQAAQALLDHLAGQAPIAPLLFKNGCVLTQWGRLGRLTPLRGDPFYQMEQWTIS